MNRCLINTLTATEAEKLWGLASGTVRAALVRGIIQGRKSAGTWLVLRKTIIEHYGTQPNKTINPTGYPGF